MITMKNGEPMLCTWFGNFYSPAFDDPGYIDETIALLSELGFNSVELDSKQWEDFQERYAGGDASAYVRMQEYMMESAKRNGLSHIFLALYLNGDNLYPNIRFSPPVFGDSVVNARGEDGRWYRYWSDKAQESMIAHVQGLQRLYGDNQTHLSLNGEDRIPICSMWDPIVDASFDEEGHQRYLRWLRGRYETIEAFNQAYETEFADFDQLQKEDYWFACKYDDRAIYTAQDRERMRPRFVMWCDNMRWKRYELTDYFRKMQLRFRALDPRLYLVPDLSQWSYFINVNGAKLELCELWDTAMRGMDAFEIAPYVDACHFLAVPVNWDGDPEPYAVTYQHSMMRSMNPDRPFMGGYFLGRFISNDVYQWLTPCELMGSIVGSGAQGIWSYGVNGLDDGGSMDRMDAHSLESIGTGNRWCKKVIPLLGGARPKSPIALLFPTAMASFEPYLVEGSEAHRADSLGWFRAACDYGYVPDVITLQMIEEGALENYRILLIPKDSCYEMEPHLSAEEKLRQFADHGGAIVHGPNDALIARTFDILGKNHSKDCIVHHGAQTLIDNPEYVCYTGEESIAQYLSDGTDCVVRNGNVYSFGFLYGFCYAVKRMPNIPYAQKNGAFYSIQLDRPSLAEKIFDRYLPKPEVYAGKGVEIHRFDCGKVIVNHNASPIELKEDVKNAVFQYDVSASLLLPHSAVFIPAKQG